jgi:eukaryotic-like serine/threonine-protein kinase
MIQQIKDFRRCVDYLETRQDIDGKKFAFYGISYGGRFGAIIPPVEPRLKASVLAGASMFLTLRPEVSPINYVTRVKIPTLMLNGEIRYLSSRENYSADVRPLGNARPGQTTEIL